jgi:uncharacterized LabA/DUF88 family protein
MKQTVALRIRIFVDFWNFQLNWNRRAGEAKCDWASMSRVLVQAARQTFPPGTELEFVELRVYASVDPEERSSNTALRTWLDTFLSRLPGYHVHVRERITIRPEVRCRSCGRVISTCACGAPFVRTSEKGVDTAIVTDLLGLAWERAYDAAILVSSDADFIPAVELIHRKGLRVLNAAWQGLELELARKCWATIHIDGLIPDLTRTNGPPSGATGERPAVVETPLRDGSADPATLETFLAEVARAIDHFAVRGGYLGVSMFLHKWTSPKLSTTGEERRQMLDQAVERGLVEIYRAGDEGHAARRGSPRSRRSSDVVEGDLSTEGQTSKPAVMFTSGR